MNSVSEFLRSKRLSKGLSMQALAEKAKISSAYVSEIENKRKKMPPSEQTLENIAYALELNEEEKKEFLKLAALERADDIIKKELEEKDKLINELKKYENISKKIEKDIMEIPVYDNVTAGSGGLIYNEPIDFIAVPDKLNNIKKLMAFKVKGDSMSPKIDNGSYILVKENVMPNNGEIGVFVVDNEWFVKIYRRLGDFVILSSINTNYKDIELNLNQDIFFKCVGKVVMVQNFL